ncbi:MAG: hypothetical protein IH587_07560 [Anaerolineae bacterium]|nr:hypothetical protein [Anaerolineae bacterium]
MTDLTPLFPVIFQAVELARHVRHLALEHSDKGGNDPVTIADYGIQALLLRAMNTHYPDDGIIAEEDSEHFFALVSPDQQRLIANLLGEVLGEPVHTDDIAHWLDYGQKRVCSRMWTIDPIDGTRGYVSGRRYSVAIGLLVDHQPAAGLLACAEYPDDDGHGVLFYTHDGVAYAQPMSDTRPPRSIHVSDTDDPALLRTVVSTDAIEIDLPRVQPVLAAAHIASEFDYVDGQDKYAMVAAGDVDFYLRPERPDFRPHNIWDHVPGVAIVQAAGGIVSDLDGEPLDFSQGKTLPKQGVVVSSASAYPRVLDAVRHVRA